MIFLLYELRAFAFATFVCRLIKPLQLGDPGLDQLLHILRLCAEDLLKDLLGGVELLDQDVPIVAALRHGYYLLIGLY
jgi:hypothetical protein